MGIVTIGLAGGDGGTDEASRRVDHCLVVPTTSSIASRNATSPPITSSGISCTRCSPTTRLGDDQGVAA